MNMKTGGTTICAPGMGRSMGIGRSAVLNLAFLAATALAGCMTPTHYQPAADGEGYGDEQIADGRYRVTFSGNSVTPRNVVDNYMLYRAAELTLASGNDYFELVSHDVERNVTYRTYVDYPGPYVGAYHHYGMWGWGPYYDPFFYGGYYGGYAEVTAQPIEKYEAYATIAVGKGERPKDNPNAYDARDVIARLGGSVLRPAP